PRAHTPKAGLPCLDSSTKHRIPNPSVDQSLSSCAGIRGSDHPTSPRKTMPLLFAPPPRSVGGRNTKATSGAALSAPPRQCPPHPPRFNSFGASGLPSTPGSRSLGYFFVAYLTFLFWVTICCPCDTYHL
ncbi:unnamed protein product, partial [Musa acuminata var. zebrina]